MRICGKLVFLPAVFCIAAASATPIEWEVLTEQDYSTDVTESTQGGYAVSGWDGDQGFISLFSQAGELVWSVEPFAFSGKSSKLHSIDEIPGGFVSCGYLTYPGGEDEIAVAAVDYDGNPLWSRIIDLQVSDYDAANLVCSTAGETFLAAAGSPSGAPDYGLVIKLSSDGDSLWSVIPEGSSEALDIGMSPSGEIAVLTETQTGSRELHVFDSDGELLWSREYPDLYLDNMAVHADGFSFILGNDMIYRMDEEGNMLWWGSYPYGPPTDSTFLNSCRATRDGGLVICGIALTTGPSDQVDGYICKIHPNGVVDWKQKLARGGSAIMKSVIQLSQGGYLTVGRRAGLGCWLVRFSPETGIGEGQTESESMFSISSPPSNPFSYSFSMGIEVLQCSDVSFTVHDLSGRLLHQETLPNCSCGDLVLEWLPGAGAASGAWIVSVRAGDQFWTKNVVYLN